MSKWSSTKKEKLPIAAENAETMVHELLDFYGIDIDDFENEAQKAGTELILNKLQKAYMRGQIENKKTDKGGFQIVQHLQAPPGDVNELVYEELQGKHKIAMDGFTDKENVARQHALLGSMSGIGAAGIKALKTVDLSVAECLAIVFLNA